MFGLYYLISKRYEKKMEGKKSETSSSDKITKESKVNNQTLEELDKDADS